MRSGKERRVEGKGKVRNRKSRGGKLEMVGNIMSQCSSMIFVKSARDRYICRYSTETRTEKAID